MISAEAAQASHDLAGRVAAIGRYQFGQAFEEKAAIDKDGDAAAGHVRDSGIVTRGKPWEPEMEKPQGVGSLSG